ncbi:iron chelate uptake ABC transporter family permease subunit [Virgibacillus sp. W0430]|uniref:iron chelate uptake ABC transporter family permease subunit n=1 Tax=Virgibacillus sp. W0430 TaxID=3391580 RepID=UPI003F456335
MRSNSGKLKMIYSLAALACVIYLLHDLNGSFDYALPRRLIKVIAMILTGISIAFATVVFQTIAHNKILTPSIMGLDSLYLLLQTTIIFFLGSTHVVVMDKKINFFICVGAMILFAFLLYNALMKNGKYPVYFLLLVGIILGTFFSSISTFLQVLIDPNEFLSVQDRMFASFNNVNADLVWIAFGLIIVVFAIGWRYIRYLDVISLGRENAINLGIPYDSTVKKMLILVAVFIAIATALVGPITFFGLIVANLAYQFFNTYKHSILITGAIGIGIIALVGGQWVVERIFTFSTTLSVIINFFGGVYFIYLLLKESRSN